MFGINKSGIPSTESYSLGRGRVYAAPLVGGLPGAYRDLGNSPDFKVSVAQEVLDHQSSRAGLKVTDKEVVISKTVNLALTLDDLQMDNLSLFFSGSSTSDIANLQQAAESTMLVFAGVQGVDVIAGRWYDLIGWDSAQSSTYLKRAYGFEAAQITAIAIGSATIVTTGGDEGTDYIIDRKQGRIFFKNTTVVTTGIGVGSATVNVTATWGNPSSGNKAVVDEVKGLANSGITVALKFISVNPVDGDAEAEYQFHQVNLKSNGDFSLISDTFTNMQLNGVAESNVKADSDSPTLTIRAVSGTKT